jgi:hypothetical protein
LHRPFLLVTSRARGQCCAQTLIGEPPIVLAPAKQPVEATIGTGYIGIFV